MLGKPENDLLSFLCCSFCCLQPNSALYNLHALLAYGKAPEEKQNVILEMGEEHMCVMCRCTIFLIWAKYKCLSRSALWLKRVESQNTVNFFKVCLVLLWFGFRHDPDSFCFLVIVFPSWSQQTGQGAAARNPLWARCFPLQIQV